MPCWQHRWPFCHSWNVFLFSLSWDHFDFLQHLDVTSYMTPGFSYLPPRHICSKLPVQFALIIWRLHLSSVKWWSVSLYLQRRFHSFTPPPHIQEEGRTNYLVQLWAQALQSQVFTMSDLWCNEWSQSGTFLLYKYFVYLPTMWDFFLYTYKKKKFVL